MTVHRFSSGTRPHYSAHIDPIWEALPAHVRGHHWTDTSPPRTDEPGMVIVASFADAQRMGNRPLILADHGAGQSYDGDPAAVGNGSYSGGGGLDAVRLFLSPSERVAARWRAAYPAARAEAVGCAKLDPWLNGARARAPRTVPPTVAVTFHFDLPLVPETRSAWRHYDYKLPALVTDPRWRVLGHGHPRLWGTIRRRWQQLGVEHTPDLDVVLDRADLLVCCNSSAMYEAAAVGIPVLCLNVPWFRRDVHHGLRFWSHPPGLQIDRPDELLAGVAHALTDPPAARALRHAAVAAAYSHTDGRAAERAATAIMEVHDGLRRVTEAEADPAPATTGSDHRPHT